ncbi:transcription factor 21 [Saccoglossus kowalevskii]|uniref:Transcription factor 21 n=1 Tax=Saccoglossus kowalevskii TaxID=10224 RepID=B5M213_SACKO|nr:transcription factor 21 [Saccoglossus kowalevskii]ACH68425.1 transcription factor 21 protein [Saccoglossus kowalevskii]
MTGSTTQRRRRSRAQGAGINKSRDAANARERTRMKILGKAFQKLKTTLPWVPSDTKLSKLDTLKLALRYIDYLNQVLDGEIVETAVTSSHTMKTWPSPFAAFLSKEDGVQGDEIDSGDDQYCAAG